MTQRRAPSVSGAWLTGGCHTLEFTMALTRSHIPSAQPVTQHDGSTRNAPILPDGKPVEQVVLAWEVTPPCQGCLRTMLPSGAPLQPSPLNAPPPPRRLPFHLSVLRWQTAHCCGLETLLPCWLTSASPPCAAFSHSSFVHLTPP